MILQIPETVNFTELFSSFPTDIHNLNTAKGRAKLADKLAWILDSIIKQLNQVEGEIIYSSYGARRENNAHVSLYSKLIEQNLGHSYKRYFKYLEECNIISYYGRQQMGRSKRYGLSQENFSTPKDHHVTDFKFLQKLRAANIEIRHSETERENHYPSGEIIERMLVHFEKLEIDYDGAVLKLNQLKATETGTMGGIAAERLYNLRLYELRNIRNGQFNITRDANVYRIHTPVVRMKRETRVYLSHAGRRLVNIDLKNSQPFILSKFLSQNYFTELKNNQISQPSFNFNHERAQEIVNENNEDIVEYKRATSQGEFYEAINQFMLKPFDERNKLKEKVLESMYAPNRTRKRDVLMVRRAIKDVYPTINRLLWELKRQDYTVPSYLLQQAESELMIDIIARRIINNHPEIPIFTVHDSFICPEENQELIKQIMEEETINYIQNIPTIDVENLY